MTSKGLTLPNWQYVSYLPNEITSLFDLAPTTLVWLLYGTAIDLTHRDQLKPYLDAHHPRIIYRPYRSDIATLDPLAWASQAAAWVNAVGLSGECIPANELNIEGMAEDWPRQITWLKAFAAAWHGGLLHQPALSPSGNYVAGYAAYDAAGLSGLAEWFGIIDAHIYANSQSLPNTNGKPLCITEFNNLDPASFFNARPAVRDCVWFLLGGTTDQARHDIIKQPANYASFKNWTGGVVPDPTFTVGPGIAALMKTKGDVPRSNEHYVADVQGFVFKSEASGNLGVYTWFKESNETHFLPFG